MRAASGMLTGLLLSYSALAQEIVSHVRLLNGTPLKGEVAEVTAEGMALRSGSAIRFYPWPALAPGTRYRFDPLYRANLAAAQQGRPVSQWPNPPDGAYSAEPLPLDAPRADAISASVAPLAFTPFPAIPPKARSSLTALDAKAGAGSLSWGLRYGPAESEAAYFVFESAGDDGLPPAMHVWTGADKRPERVRMSRRADGEEARAIFREHRFRAVREDVEVTYRIAPTASTRAPGALLVSAEVELKKGLASSSFSLVGAPPGVLAGDGNVVARDLLAPPTLLMALESIGGKMVFAGAVRMGRLRLIPRSGMDRAISIDITDERGQKALAAEIPFSGDAPTDKHSFLVPLDGLSAGRKYALNARMSLGPFLGEVSYQERFVLK
jgi:hypothetical protein